MPRCLLGISLRHSAFWGASSQLSFTQFPVVLFSGAEMIFRVMKYYRPQLHAPFCKLDGGFKCFFMFIPTWGNDPNWRSYFSNGWFNHQPEIPQNSLPYIWIKFKTPPKMGPFFFMIPASMISYHGPWGLWIHALQRGSRLHHEYSQVPSAQNGTKSRNGRASWGYITHSAQGS